MTALAISTYPDSAVRGIICAVIVGQVTSHTSIWRNSIITIMALVAVCGGMCPGERIVIIMNCK